MKRLSSKSFLAALVVTGAFCVAPALAQVPPSGVPLPGGNAPGPKTAPSFAGTTWAISVPGNGIQKIELRADNKAVVTTKAQSSVQFTWSQNNGVVTVKGTMGAEALTITGSLATKIQGGFEVNTGSVSIVSVVNGKAAPTMGGTMSKAR